MLGFLIGLLPSHVLCLHNRALIGLLAFRCSPLPTQVRGTLAGLG